MTAYSDITKNNRRCFAALNMTAQGEFSGRGRVTGNAEVWKSNRRCFAALSMTVRFSLIGAVD